MDQYLMSLELYQFCGFLLFHYFNFYQVNEKSL